MLYDQRFLQGGLRKLQKYALILPNGPAGFGGELAGGRAYVGVGVDGALSGRSLTGLGTCDWGTASATGGVYDVTLDLHNHHSVSINEIDTKYGLALTFAGAGAGFPAYFLPWDSAGGAAYMTLGPGGPDHFFTAALSGCSVMVAGPADAPTVYHCGVENWDQSPYTLDALNPRPVMADSPNLWHDLVRHIRGDDDFSTINLTQYLTDFDSEDFSTPDSRAMEVAVQQNRGDPTAMAISKGAVFGLKGGDGSWSFYLQKNVGITWKKRKLKIRGPRGWPSRVELNLGMERPLEVAEFYPGNVTHARRWHL